MHIATLRTVGGSVMMVIPKAILEALGLAANEKVGLSVADGRLVVEPHTRPRYSLDELVAQCDPDAPISDEEREWMAMKPVGKEIW
jgi:antitoxin ChpS